LFTYLVIFKELFGSIPLGEAAVEEAKKDFANFKQFQKTKAIFYNNLEFKRMLIKFLELEVDLEQADIDYIYKEWQFQYSL